MGQLYRFFFSPRVREKHPYTELLSACTELVGKVEAPYVFNVWTAADYPQLLADGKDVTFFVEYSVEIEPLLSGLKETFSGIVPTGEPFPLDIPLWIVGTRWPK